MSETGGNAAVRRRNRERIAMYILDRGSASRQELAEELGLSMPTVFQNVGELLSWGLIREDGSYHSTGGRKARRLVLNRGVCCALGIEVTAQCLHMVLLDLTREVLAAEAIPLAYTDSDAYYEELGRLTAAFAGKNSGSCPVEGVGIALPGIIDQQRGVLVRSHALDVSNVELLRFSCGIPYPALFGNDANLAAYAEVSDKSVNTLYLSLNDTVGGAVYLNGELYLGENWRSGEFGHMVVEPGGRLCYCGKRGCLDSYCSARVLRREGNGLEGFFDSLRTGDPRCSDLWEDYLEHLAVAVSNLRMAFDCDIVLGGDVGGCLRERMDEFSGHLAPYNRFDTDSAYIRPGQLRRESAAIGGARQVLDRYIHNLQRVER